MAFISEPFLSKWRTAYQTVKSHASRYTQRTLTRVNDLFLKKSPEEFSLNKIRDDERTPGLKGLDWNFASISMVLPYRYYDETSEFFINEQSIGFGWELSVLAGADEKVVKHLSDLFRFKLSDEVDFQVVLWGNRQVSAALNQYHHAQRPLNDTHAALIDTAYQYYQRGAQGGFVNPRHMPLFLRDYRVFAFVSKKTTYTPRAVEELQRLRTTIEAEWKSSEFNFRRLVLPAWLNLLTAWINPDPSLDAPQIHHDELETLNHQIVDRSLEWIHHPELLSVIIEPSSRSNQKSHQASFINLSLNTLPDQFALWMSADNFCNVLRLTQAIQCPFLISLHLRLVPNAQAKANAQHKYYSLDKKANSVYAKRIAGTTKAAAEWKKIRDELASDEIRIAKCFYNVVLFSDPEHEKRDEASAIACFRYNGMELYNTKYMHLQSFLATLPFTMSEGLYQDLDRIGRLRTMTTWNLANLLPLVADYKASRQGLLLPTFRHQLAFFDPFDESVGITNFNLAVAATSGAGKSFFVQSLLLSILARGGKVWVIDIGESYKKLCHLMGGTYLTYQQLKLNPFTHVVDIQESCEKIRDLLAVLASPQGNLDDVQLNYLLQAVLEAWENKKQQATIDEVVAKLHLLYQEKSDARIDDLIILLSKYVSTGPYGDIFNRPSVLSPDLRFVVLELGELKDKPDLLKAVLFAQILSIEEQLYESERDTLKMVVLDEAWRFLSGDNRQAASFIETGYRTARRHRASFVTITQSINDFHQSQEAEAAWNCSDMKVIMRQNAKAFDDFLVEHPSFYSPYEQALIKSFGAAKDNGFSELLLQLGPVSSFHRLLTDPFSRVLFSSAGDEVQVVERLQQKGLTLSEAVLQVAKERYQEEF